MDACGAPSVHVDMPTPSGPIVSVCPAITVVTGVAAPGPMWNVRPLISTAVRPNCVTVAPPTISYIVASGAAVMPPKVSPPSCKTTPVGATKTVSPSTTVVSVLLPSAVDPYVIVVPEITTVSEPIAVISCPPMTAVCVGPDPAATCSVWLEKMSPAGPMVIDCPWTTAIVGVGAMVNTVPSIVAIEEGPRTTPRPPIEVVIGGS